MISQQLPSSVSIREVGPREGFQILPRFIETDKKLALIEALLKAGLKEIEVTSFVRPDRVPTMADAETLVEKLPRVDGVKFSALYLNVKGFLRSIASGRLTTRGWLYSSPSESFLRANNNTSISEALAEVPRWRAEFCKVGKKIDALMVSTAFGCGFEGVIRAEAVAQLVERYLNACAQCGESLSEICLADTNGVAHPNSIRACIQILRSFGVPISLHLHNTWGLGISNVYAGLCEGVRIFESSTGGLGGCPFTPGASGNVATEDVVYLCHALGISTGLDLNKLCEAAELAESIVGTDLTGGVYKSWKHSGRKLSFMVEKGARGD